MLETKPQDFAEQPLPLTLQVTAVLVDPVTVAVNCCVCPVVTCAAAGETCTTIGGVTVTTACADLLGFAVEVAVTVTCGGLGTELGAV